MHLLPLKNVKNDDLWNLDCLPSAYFASPNVIGALVLRLLMNGTNPTHGKLLSYVVKSRFPKSRSFAALLTDTNRRKNGILKRLLPDLW